MAVPTSNIGLSTHVNAEVTSVNSTSLTTLAGNAITYTGGNSPVLTDSLPTPAPHGIREFAGYVHTQTNSGDVNNASGTWSSENWRLGASSATDTSNRSYTSSSQEVGTGGFESNDMRAIARIRPFTYSISGITLNYLYLEMCVTMTSGYNTSTGSYNGSGTFTTRSPGTYVSNLIFNPNSFFGSGTPDSYGMSYSRNETYSPTVYGNSSRSWSSAYDSTNNTNFGALKTTYNAHNNNFYSPSSNQSTGLGFYQSVVASYQVGNSASTYVKNDIYIQFKARKAGYHDFTFATGLLTMRTDATSVWSSGGGPIP